MRRCAVAILLLSPSWLVAQFPPQQCAPLAPAGAAPLEADSVEHLAGAFDMYQVWLSSRQRTIHYRLELIPSDSLTRFYEDRGLLRIRRGDRPLMGTLRLLDPPRPKEFGPWSAGVVLEGATLYVGCRGCNDANPTQYLLIAQTPTLLWGLWENFQTGIDYLAHPDGSRAPNPAGYFCMRRARAQ